MPTSYPVETSALDIVTLTETSPWEHLTVPKEIDGSRGTFRAPNASCLLSVGNDYEAVQAWLGLQDAGAALRACCKEVERLMLWAILERGKALSSLTTEDAIAYLAFMRRPSPPERWIGPGRPRTSSRWRPFQGRLAPRFVAHALSVVDGLYCWLMEQRYVLTNPFAGLEATATARATAIGASRGFTGYEWALIRSTADGIEGRSGWSEVGAQRIRFVLDFWYATGLQPSELVNARLGEIEHDAQGDVWLHVVDKGAMRGKVYLPLLARDALGRYLEQRHLPATRTQWDPDTALVASLAEEATGITASRLWCVMRRFFHHAAHALDQVNRPTSERLMCATPHWIRHTQPMRTN